ncbi:unnamed protein product [Urochloa humidicola]
MFNHAVDTLAGGRCLCNLKSSQNYLTRHCLRILLFLPFKCSETGKAVEDVNSMCACEKFFGSCRSSLMKLYESCPGTWTHAILISPWVHRNYFLEKR